LVVEEKSLKRKKSGEVSNILFTGVERGKVRQGKRTQQIKKTSRPQKRASRHTHHLGSRKEGCRKEKRRPLLLLSSEAQHARSKRRGEVSMEQIREKED